MGKSSSQNKLNYADAGVDIRAGEDAVERIKALAQQTFTPGVLSEIGSFGGFFKPDFGAFANPVLISSADGVGTKLKLAFMTDKHDTVGEDLVNHCLNDILVHGARGLFFLDYIATGKLKPEVIAEIVTGLSRGCRNNKMALLGGETAEMPDFYTTGEYDLAGFIVGMVDQDKIINGSAIQHGDVCIALGSDGLHTNGYTLARKIAFDVLGLNPGDHVDALGMSVGEALMKVHRCYGTAVHALLDEVEVRGMAHITGGGIPGNLKRIIPDNLSAVIDRSTWAAPPLFQFLQSSGNVESDDMYDAFNMGVGYIVVVEPSLADQAVALLNKSGERAWVVGHIDNGANKVTLA